MAETSRKLPRVLRPSNLDGVARSGSAVDPERLVSIESRVGREIRELRRARDITLARLSEVTGLSQGLLSQIETGKSEPSIKSLHAIARALGVGISWFFPDTPASGDAELADIVVRRGSRRSLSFDSGITDELLSPNLGRQIELLRCVFAPGSESGAAPYSHIGEEAGVLISGQLHLWLGEREIVLKEGDSFAFSSETPHRYANLGDRETVVIWAISPPSY